MNKLGANPMKSIVAVAEMAYAPDCGSGLCEFESHRSHYALIRNEVLYEK